MARIFITGSSDGLGMLAAKELLAQGHQVCLHARNEARRDETWRQAPTAQDVFVADLSDRSAARGLAEELNQTGPFDVVIHNAGVYQVSPDLIFAVNTLAPYILTSMMNKPRRLIYLSSGMHLQGHPNFENFELPKPGVSYSDSKFHVVLLSMAVARVWSDVYSNSVDPGWVPTKMGGSGAPDDLQKGYETQTWLAVSNDANATVSGRYFFHRKERRCNPLATDVVLQNRFLEICAKVTGILFPSK